MHAAYKRQPKGMRLVYIDESGGHNLACADPNYPVFVLAAAVFATEPYIQEFVPAITRIKITHLRHDGHPLHEAEIRKRLGSFDFRGDTVRQSMFMESLGALVANHAHAVHAQVILSSHRGAGRADLFAAHRLLAMLARTSDEPCVLVLEQRGRSEDMAMRQQLEKSAERLGLQAQIDFCPKKHAVPGLELADLVARPIGLHALRPGQPNRAFALIERGAQLELHK